MYALEPIQTPFKPLRVNKMKGILKELLFIYLFLISRWKVYFYFLGFFDLGIV